MDTLLNWSGGIDSTYCLVTYLQKHRSTKLLVHHTRLRNHQRRDEAEQEAITAIRRQLKIDGLTNYEYLETGIDYGNLDDGTPIMDHEIIALWSGIILRNPRYWGVTKIIAPFMADLHERVERIKLWQDVYHTIRPLPHQRRAPKRPAQLVMPIRHMTKAQLLAGLPPQYRPLVWWCRRPQPTDHGFVTCVEAGVRQCDTCRSVLTQFPEANEWRRGHS